MGRKRGRGGVEETTVKSSQKKKTRKREVVKQRKKEKFDGRAPRKEPETENHDTKTSRQWAFRAGLGLLYDLFAGTEEKRLVLNDKQRDLLKTTTFWNLIQVFIDNQITKDELEKPPARAVLGIGRLGRPP
ncbi:hypothetical protein MKW92_011248 [Papaver armeniacum]|nr:hypothetical protein MKW92_011248 [Papaver armeniacum]